MPLARLEYFQPERKIRILAQGLTMNAIAGEKNLAKLEPMGIGRI